MSLDREIAKEKGLPLPVIAVVAVVIAIIVVVIVMGQKQKFEPVVAGSDIIDFTLPDLEGNERKLSDYSGKVIFLNFWATWCKPCAEEMPSMQKVYEQFEGKPFEIVAVSVDSEPASTVAEFVETYGITFPVLHDRSGKIKETYKTTGVPETFIVDQNGVVAEKVWGPRDWLEPASLKVINDLLENGPKPRDAYRKKKGGA
jgi:peroxiredoxin